jgi:hypothetical protein
MTYKIERLASGKNSVVLRASGRIQAEDVKAIKELVEQEIVRVALDLAEVELVDRDVVSFLAACELKGIELSNCPAFLREWIGKEKLRMGAEPQERASESANDNEDP